jgi:hypothetical protein
MEGHKFKLGEQARFSGLGQTVVVVDLKDEDVKVLWLGPQAQPYTQLVPAPALDYLTEDGRWSIA